MATHIPRVSVGLPVYNGEAYLARVIESFLGQSYEDFELVISDNASTDRTPEICRQFADTDARIRYHRAEENRGAAWNYNRVLELARGEYFKWAACDDLCAPTFLQRSVEVLDADPDALWCFPQTTFIDPAERIIAEPRAEIHSYGSTAAADLPPPLNGARRVQHPLGRESELAHERFAAVLLDFGGAYDHYGLVRRRELAASGRVRPFAGSDKVLVAELSLAGRFVEIPEVLMLWRHHPAQHGMQSRLTTNRVLSGQWNRRFFVPRRLLCTWWYARLILTGPISWYERFRCLATLAYAVCQPKRWWSVLEELIHKTVDWQAPAAETTEEILPAGSAAAIK